MPLTRTRWPIFAALVIGGAAIAAFWYSVLADPRGEAVPASGGRYLEAVLRAPERMNPLFSSANPTDADIASLVFSGLVRLGPDGTPQPDLAERWEITGNGQSYVFHLRRGIAWQDGRDFSADDVVFTYRLMSAPGFKGDTSLAQLMQGVTVSARDPLTVEFRLEQTYAPFLAYLTVGILPQHLLEGLDQNQLFNAPFNQQPVGTGPYRFGRRSAGGIELETNPTYYLGPPKITTLEFRVFPDASALASALRAHSVDGALLGEEMSRPEFASLKDDAAFSLHRMPTTSYFTIYLDTRSSLFQDASVRRALLQGLNRDRLIAESAGGGARTETGIAPEWWASSPEEGPPFDPGAAASALEKAGFSQGSDGVRTNGDVRLAFTLSTTNDPERVTLAQSVARQWRSIGVAAEVQPLSADSFIDEHLLPRNFAAALVAIDPGPDPDPYPFWHTSQIAPPGRNLSNYSDPRIDDALSRARQTTDTSRRKDLYSLFGGYLIAATPSIPLYAPALTYVQSSRVQAFRESLLFSPSSRFASVTDWYVSTRTR